MKIPNTLTKFDVARRQLVTAIRLHFDNRDAVSIYSLATNAQEILSTLCENRGVRSLRSNIVRVAGMTDDEAQKDLINPSRNFFKHADRDPEGQWEEFRENDCDHILIMPCFDIVELEGKSPIEAQIFIAWYAAIYPEKVPSHGNIKDAANRKFPNLVFLPRIEQKQHARKLLREALDHIQLMSHPETDTREVGTWGDFDKISGET